METEDTDPDNTKTETMEKIEISTINGKTRDVITVTMATGTTSRSPSLKI